MKLYIIGGALIAALLSGFWTGYQVASGKAAKQQIKVVAEVIENSNQDKKEITKHITKTNQVKAGAVREIIKIKEIIVNTECPLSDVASMRNETITRFPPDLFIQ